MHRRQSTEEGAVVILVAIMMVALLTIVALVVDLGDLYDQDRDLQSAADGAALAGAQELIYTSGSILDAEDMGQEYALDNIAENNFLGNLAPWSGSYSSGTSSVEADPDGVTVDLLETDVPYFFAPVIGRLTGSVRAHARAEVKYISGVNDAFPVTIMYMDPDRFRFVFSKGNTEFGHFDLTDGNNDGVFDMGNGSFTPSSAGLYDVTLQALDIDGEVALELEDIGLWRVTDPSDPDEDLYRVGMTRVGGGQILIRAEVSASVAADPLYETLSGSLGGNSFTLTDPDDDGEYEGMVDPPTGYTNDGYDLHDLEIEKVTAARYMSFADDVPINDVMMSPGFYDGYSGQVGVTAYPSARIEVDQLSFGTYVVMKLGNQAGSGLYSGNWRLVDLYVQGNVRDEMGTMPVPDDWDLSHDLVVGGPLDPKTGADVGGVKQGLSDRLDGQPALFTASDLAPGGLTMEEMRDIWAGSVYGSANNDPHFVIVPMTDYSVDLTGSSEHYRINGFAAFYITDWSKDGNCNGVFIRWVSGGEWQDEPVGPMYIETAVMVE